MPSFPGYDPSQSYDWNYAHAPDPPAVDVPEFGGAWRFCGLPVESPLGMPAGPLLNGRWVLYYAALGFDVLTYKTVRSVERACYPAPNLLAVDSATLDGGDISQQRIVRAADAMHGSWAVSFGMPSRSPDVWRRDVAETRRRLPGGKALVVSVVATQQPGWGIDELADDYARCARWAVDSGADAVEANFSCPNVDSPDGQLYQDPEAAALVAARLRDALGRCPALVKIGHVVDVVAAKRLLEAVGPHVDGLAMTNCLAARVDAGDGRLAFDGQPRGIAGAATRRAAVAQVVLFRRLAEQRGGRLTIVGVGGAATAADVAEYLVAGADAVQMATAAMLDPTVAIEIRRQWQAEQARAKSLFEAPPSPRAAPDV